MTSINERDDQAGGNISPSDSINGRIDRIPVWPLSRWAYAAVGITYFFIWFDLGTVSVALPAAVAHLNLSESSLKPPVTWNLVAYVVGACILGYLADRIGRRRAFVLGILILASGGFLTAFSWDLGSLIAFRVMIGLGTGGLIAVTASLLGEVSNSTARGRFLATCVVWGAIGAATAPFLGLWLVPIGDDGWRVFFAAGVLCLISLPFCRDSILPESPRWLLTHGQSARAERIVAAMEARARAITGTELPPVPMTSPVAEVHSNSVASLFTRSYLARTVVVIGFWSLFYLMVYGWGSYAPTLIEQLGFSRDMSILFTGLGALGGLVGIFLTRSAIERFERKHLIAYGVVICIVGLLLFTGGAIAALVIAGSVLVSLGNMVVIPTGYAYTAEMFPTDVRASAAALGDGVGHVGGAVAPYVAIGLLESVGPRAVFIVLAAVAVVGTSIILLGPKTKRLSLTQIAGD
jgi:MFS transporter, putative metabolite:H+ symporter